MGDLVFEPPRDGPTLWEIGIPDRSAAEFYVPDPDPNHINKLFVNHPDRLAILLQFQKVDYCVIKTSILFSEHANVETCFVSS